MTLADHPGFMEYEDGSIEVLHADWPVYPVGHGWKVALQSLAMFPQAVRFRQIDDIDQCLLLVATGSGPCLAPQGNSFDEKWFHVAVWRDDLKALCEQQFVTGVSLINGEVRRSVFNLCFSDRLRDHRSRTEQRKWHLRRQAHRGVRQR